MPRKSALSLSDLPPPLPHPTSRSQYLSKIRNFFASNNSLTACEISKLFDHISPLHVKFPSYLMV